MAPKRSSRAKAGALGQSALSFQTRKPGTTGKKPSLSSVKSQSTTSLQSAQSPSTHSIVIEQEETAKPTPHAAKEEAIKEVVRTKNEGRRRLDVKDKQWEGVKKAARLEMGGMSPIHAGPETHNDIHHVLRVFDLTASYGPCVGVSRLQRWERAKKWGLNPPEEIKLILTTQEGEDEAEYRENVLHPWLG